MRFVIVNSNPAAVSAFKAGIAQVKNAMSGRASVHCFEGTLGEYVASVGASATQKTAVVAPANSLCFMGGGFDRAIAELFTETGQDYRTFEAVVQSHALAKYHGFVPPQSTHVVDLKEAYAAFGQPFPTHTTITHLIQTPSMVVPEAISATTVFHCTWNTLVAAHANFDTVILPAFGAGYGAVPVPVVARTMCGALGLFFMEMEPPARRGAAVLLFLNKDYRALGDAEDIAKVEEILSPAGRDVFGGRENRGEKAADTDESPLEWSVFSRCLQC